MVALEVVAGALIRGTRVLATRRVAGRSQGGLWEFPGGKIEPGETPQQALQRELNEELGLSVAVGPWMATSEVVVRDRPLRMRLYEVQGTGQLQLHDHDALVWVNAERLLKLRWAPADVPLLNRVAERLRAG